MSTESYLALIGIPSLVLLLTLVLMYGVNRPKRVVFHPARSRDMVNKVLPKDFAHAWECLEQTVAKKVSATAPPSCPHCSMNIRGRYPVQYRFQRFIWSGLERQHIMYAHVQYGDDNGYYLPDQAFITAVMHWYATEYLPKQQSQPILQAEPA